MSMDDCYRIGANKVPYANRLETHCALMYLGYNEFATEEERKASPMYLSLTLLLCESVMMYDLPVGKSSYRYKFPFAEPKELGGWEYDIHGRLVHPVVFEEKYREMTCLEYYDLIKKEVECMVDTQLIREGIRKQIRDRHD